MYGKGQRLNALNAQAPKQRFMMFMQAVGKCSTLWLLSLMLTALSRREAKAGIEQLPQHSSCRRCLLSRHHSCRDARELERVGTACIAVGQADASNAHARCEDRRPDVACGCGVQHERHGGELSKGRVREAAGVD